jgi:hypothetical protein
LILAAGLLAGLIALPVQAGSITGGVDLIGVNVGIENDLTENWATFFSLRLSPVIVLDENCYPLMPEVEAMFGVRFYPTQKNFLQALIMTSTASIGCYSGRSYYDIEILAGRILIGRGTKHFFNGLDSSTGFFWEASFGVGLAISEAVASGYSSFAFTVGPTVYYRLALGYEGKPSGSKPEKK